MHFVLAILFFVSMSSFAAAPGSPKQTVLFTTFDPFGGSPTNNTQAIGALLRAHPDWIGPGTSVTICNLPVVYGEAPKQALDCIAREKPDLVVSLGEAGCSLQVESAANNSDDTPGFPDNAGVVREAQPIVPGGPARLGFAFPVEAMMCAIDPDGLSGVIASISPGNFVCNNLAYSLAYQLGPKNLPFTFIHVPNSRCAPSDADPEANARRIAQAVAAAQAALTQPSATSSLWRPSAQGERMPSTWAEISILLTGFSSRSDVRNCELKYAQRLGDAYQLN